MEPTPPTQEEEQKQAPSGSQEPQDTFNQPINEEDLANEAKLVEKLKNLTPARPTSDPGIFWSTQPVPKPEEYYNSSMKAGAIDEKKTVEMIRKDGYPLPSAYEWVDVNLGEEEDGKRVYELLSENYVEDDDNMFRFDYSVEFLRWALLPPNYYKEWIVGVQVKKSKKLVAFITAIPLHLMAEEHKIKMGEVNFLCVHKKLRHARLAPVLIKEITRRVNLKNIWQAIYTAGVEIPTPFSQARYYHRSLNPKKLIESNFSSLGRNQTLGRLVKLYKLPETTKIEGLRSMKSKDVAQVHKLMADHLAQFKIYTKYTEEEVKHWLLPRKDVIYTYVVEKNKKITDFFSFYSLPSSILKHPVHKTLRAAYSYYNVANTVTLVELINDALTVANNEGFDVFNALDILDNKKFLEEMKFSPGDGNLHYYLYNWRLSKALIPQEIGIVLV